MAILKRIVLLLSATSIVAVLSVNCNKNPVASSSAPTIELQSQSQTVLPGTLVDLQIQAIGTDPLTYQWTKNGTAIAGVSSANYEIDSLTSADTGVYTCTVTNSLGSATSDSIAVRFIFAPVIKTQPVAQNVAIGAPCTLAVKTTGTAPIKFQWKRNGVAIRNAFDSSLIFNRVAGVDTGKYCCIVYNSAGAVTTDSAQLTIKHIAPYFTQQSQTQIVDEGTAFALTTVVIGDVDSSRWSKNGILIAGAKSSTYSKSTAANSDTGLYVDTVYSALGNITSTPIRITLKYIHPVITTQPKSQSVVVGTAACTLAVVATGSAPTYNWYKNNSSTIVSTRNKYAFPVFAPADTGTYFCVIANGTEVDTSNVVTLTIAHTVPTITSQPTNQIADAGAVCSLNIKTVGDTLMRYQWIKNGLAIPGASGAKYLIPVLSANDTGRYTCLASNSIGSTCSDTVSVSIYSVFQNAQKISAGGTFVLILRNDGTLWGCGDNTNGQLGDNTIENKKTPVLIMSSVQTMAAGGSHSLILRTDGSLWGCGNNANGELGDGTTINSFIPKQIMTGVQDVGAGMYHSLVLKTDGTLWTSGNNSGGQLCNGNTTNSFSFTNVLGNVQKISGGAFHTLILKSDNTAWACGDNVAGQLGDGSFVSKSAPVQILSGCTDISAGWQQSFFLTTTGALLSCGNNLLGQIGNSDTTANSIHNVPVEIMTGVIAMDAQLSIGFAIKSDNTLWAFGKLQSPDKQAFQFGLTQSITPVQVKTGVKSIAAGNNFCLYQLTTGMVWATGLNSAGQLCDGTVVDKSAPVRVLQAR